MTVAEVAQKLINFNNANDHESAYAELYTPDAVSIENWGNREVYEGMDAIKMKGEKWFETVEEMHEVKMSEPLIADESFAITFTMDVTFNEKAGPMAGRSQLTELAIYRVNKNGKIYHEEFMG